MGSKPGVLGALQYPEKKPNTILVFCNSVLQVLLIYEDI